MTKIAAFFIAIFLILSSFLGLQPYGMFRQVYCQGEVYFYNYQPEMHIPATLEKDAPELTYIGKITSITRKYAEPSKELQGNRWEQWGGKVYLHEDGYLYFFPVFGDAFTLISSYDALA